MKAFVFTIDSFIALILALFAISVMLYVSSSPRSAAISYSQMYMIADDALEVLSEAKVDAVDNETAIVGIGKFISKGEISLAGEIAKKTLEPVIPQQFGFSVEYKNEAGEWIVAYSRSMGKPELKASSVRVVFWENRVEAGEWCKKGCANCNIPVNSEIFGPVVIRVSVWV